MRGGEGAVTLGAGLFGKLPAHGDFVARGFDAGVAGALDAWLTAGVARLRAAADDAAFAAAMTAAPLWHGWLPLGDGAFHGVLTPTVDAAGRYFLLAAGCAGPAGAVWAVAALHPGFAAAAEAAAYDALAGRLDADALHARLAAALPAPDGRARFLASLSQPADCAFWAPDPAAGAPLAVRAPLADAMLVERLIAPDGVPHAA